MINISHYKSLLKLGIPIVIGQLGMIVLGFADTLMIGHTAQKTWLPPVS